MTTVEAAGGGPAFRVLIVDNRSDRRELMRHVVAGTGLAAPDVAEAATAEEATALLEVDGCDVVVVEIQLPVALGLETIATLRRHAPASRIVVCSFHQDEATKVRAQAEGADAYLDKPINSRSLHDVLCGLTAEPPLERPCHTKEG
ncbi:MAG: response regulator [Acidimicrobiia bacterium]